MKKILKLTAFAALLLGLAGTIATCDKEKTGNVPFKPCPCEEEQPLLEQFPRGGEAYLFRDSIPEQMLSNPPPHRDLWIIFDSDADIATFLIGYGHVVPGVGRICNFPDFAKEWDIPKNGRKVYFEGLVYEPCWGGVANQTYFDFILTNLKRR